jgi:hypothetical protein
MVGYATHDESQHELRSDVPVDARKILEPVKPVITRWNSHCSCFERGVKLQSDVNAYANQHVRRVRYEYVYATARRNKLADAPQWMRSDGLTAADWALVTEYIDVLKPRKAATKCLEGRGKTDDDAVAKRLEAHSLAGRFGAIAEIILVFEYVLNYYKQCVELYEAVNYNAHNKDPEDHLAIYLRAAQAYVSDYYSKLDLSLAYYTATILHLCYQTYCDAAWSNRPDWLNTNNRVFRALWAQYNTSSRVSPRPKMLSNNTGDAIDSLINSTTTSDDISESDEYERWRKSEPRAEKESEWHTSPIKDWAVLRDRYLNFSKLALDVLSIPVSSCGCECMLSELGDLLEPRRRCIKPQLLAAIMRTKVGKSWPVRRRQQSQGNYD